MLRPLARVTLFSFFASLGLACSGVPQFPLPHTAVDRLESFEVDRHANTFSWKERLDFGPWHVRDVDRGWTRRPSSFFEIGGERWNLVFRNWKVFRVEGRHWAWDFRPSDLDRPDVTRDFSFAMDSSGELAWSVQCGQELTLEWEALTCALRDEVTQSVWILALANEGATEPFADWLEGSEQEVMTGTLSDGETSWDLVETFRLENIPISSLSDPTGYYFLDQGQLTGAVDLFGDGRVWLDDAGPRAPRAAAAAVLLLHRSLRAEEKEREHRVHRRLASRHQ